MHIYSLGYVSKLVREREIAHTRQPTTIGIHPFHIAACLCIALCCIQANGTHVHIQVFFFFSFVVTIFLFDSSVHAYITIAVAVVAADNQHTTH